jgi:collagenase-like PrtC family protease
MNMKLAVGPLLYLWDRAFALRFYAELCEVPVDIVYLGEVVCSKRRALQREDWQAISQMLTDAGKQVVFSTLALIEAESEVASASRIVEDNALVEANDYAAIQAVSGHDFVAGPHLNVYNEATLAFLARHGARRWVAPIELPLSTVATLSSTRPANMELELFAYGRMPLAFSARCFTAHAHHLRPVPRWLDVVLARRSALPRVQRHSDAVRGDRESPPAFGQNPRGGRRHPAPLTALA